MLYGLRGLVVIRVGMMLSFDSAWLGGVNYFRNLLTAVYTLPINEREIEFIVFVPCSINQDKLLEFPQVKFVKTKILDKYSFLWMVRKIALRLFSKDFLLESLLDTHKIQVLSHSVPLSKASKIKTISWIPDFQHIHLPNFFSESELLRRDKEFNNFCQYSNKVVVSSYDALKDLHQFSSLSKDKSAVLRFAVLPNVNHQGLQTLDDLKIKYSFSTAYFLLPNQFWIHKNHQVVIKALSILKKQGLSVLVIATGNTVDFRQPNHFLELIALIEDLNVGDCFKVLGTVPLNDLQALMRHANAIINPSIFEGWSTTVEEAKSLGKKIFLSNIPVHIEQNPVNGLYFNPNDADALAQYLKQCWNIESALLLDIENSFSNAMERYVQFARQYQKIVTHTIANETSKG